MGVEVVTSLADVRAVIAADPGSSVGFDTEMHGREVRWKDRTWLDWFSAELTGFSIATVDSSWYVPVRHVEGPNAELREVVGFLCWLIGQRKHRRIWAHNWKVELQILRNEGIVLDDSDDLYDSMVAAWLAGWGRNHQKLNLKALASRHGLGSGDTFEELAKKRRACDIPVAEIAPYAGRDAVLTLTLGERAYATFDAESVKHFHEIDMPIVEVVRSIEAWGTPVDANRVNEQYDRLAREAAEMIERFEFLTTTHVMMPVKVKEPTGEFFKNGNPKMRSVERPFPFELGAKISNDHQVSRWLYDELRLWPTDGLKVNGAGHWPVDKETLERFTLLPGLAGELASMRLEWAWRDKLCKTYLKPLRDLPPQYADGLLHTSLHQTGTDTQRFSSSSPNLQNVPSRTVEGAAIRKALRARDGWEFIIFDYSQIELRIMAHLSRDPALMAAYWLDIDVHQGTLDKMRRRWPAAQRVHSKTTNFSTIYRISPPSLAIKMKSSVEEAEASIEAFFEEFEYVTDYHQAAIDYAAKHGYARTIDGFKRFLDVGRNGWMNWSVQNEAINTPIQGSAAGLAKIAMIRMHRRWREMGVYGSRVNLGGQEHDAIIAEARTDFAAEAYEHMKIDMESAMRLRVPIIAEGGRGPSWGEAKH